MSDQPPKDKGPSSWSSRLGSFWTKQKLVIVMVGGVAVAHLAWLKLQKNEVVQEMGKPKRTLVSKEIIPEKDMQRVEKVVEQFEKEAAKVKKELEGVDPRQHAEQMVKSFKQTTTRVEHEVDGAIKGVEKHVEEKVEDGKKFVKETVKKYGGD